MHLLQPRAIDMGINLRRRDIGVAEHGLHRAQVGAAFEQMGRERMAQGVRRDSFVDAGGQSVAANQFPEALAAERLAGAVGEDIRSLILPLSKRGRASVMKAFNFSRA